MNRVRPTFVKKATVNIYEANVPTCSSSIIPQAPSWYGNSNCWSGIIYGTNTNVAMCTDDNQNLKQLCILPSQ